MKLRSPSLTVCTALVAGTLFLGGAAMAQQTQPGAAGGSPPAGQPGTAGGGAGTQGQPGVTSGPAAGTPATLGTGGVTPASPHQMHTVRRHHAKSVRNEHKGQAGGTGMRKVHAKPGTEAGPAPKAPEGTQNENTGGQPTGGAPTTTQ